MTIGQGQAGTGGVVPRQVLEGWPIPGNAIEFVLQQALPSTQALLLLGATSAQLPIGLGTLLVNPLIGVTVPTSLANPGTGEARLELRFPQNPILFGATLVTQYWVIDPGATTGFSHTDGLVIIL